MAEIIGSITGDPSVPYETSKIEWKDLTFRIYTPDFILPNGIRLEVKGLWDSADRRKHLAIRKQYPTLDIRFVFQNAQKRLTKSSQTTYAAWCVKHGFRFTEVKDAETLTEWAKEPTAADKLVDEIILHPESPVRRKYGRRRTK